MQDGTTVTSGLSSTARPHHGTRVVLKNIFHNRPVRRKAISVDLETDSIRYHVAAIALANPAVAISLVNSAKCSRVLSTRGASTVPSVFAQLFGASRARSLVSVQSTRTPVVVSGYVSTAGHHSTGLQVCHAREDGSTFPGVPGSLPAFVELVLPHRLLNTTQLRRAVYPRQRKTSFANKTPQAGTRHPWARPASLLDSGEAARYATPGLCSCHILV